MKTKKLSIANITVLTEIIICALAIIAYQALMHGKEPNVLDIMSSIYDDSIYYTGYVYSSAYWIAIFTMAPLMLLFILPMFYKKNKGVFAILATLLGACIITYFVLGCLLNKVIMVKIRNVYFEDGTKTGELYQRVFADLRYIGSAFILILNTPLLIKMIREEGE